MTPHDPLLTRLAALPPAPPSEALTRRIRSAARARLELRAVHPAWTVLVAACVATYLGWAVHFASSLH